MSVEEAKERRDRLARMRNLLFYHEQKAKRAKAIKSRDYHRHAKKAAKWQVGTGADLGGRKQLFVRLPLCLPQPLAGHGLPLSSSWPLRRWTGLRCVSVLREEGWTCLTWGKR